MEKLMDGLRHFGEHVFCDRKEALERSARGQRPLVLLVTCSDSQVPTNTQTGPSRLQWTASREDEMRQVITGVAWWLVLTSPVIAYAVYELTRHPYSHPDIGPHGGVIVEWDETHETVAEVVIDRQCGILTAYVLDPWAKRSRDLRTRSIDLTLDAPKPMVVKLLSVPRGWYQPDWASRFSSGPVLEPGFRSEFVGTISVVASGRQYTGHFRAGGGRR